MGYPIYTQDQVNRNLEDSGTDAPVLPTSTSQAPAFSSSDSSSIFGGGSSTTASPPTTTTLLLPRLLRLLLVVLVVVIELGVEVLEGVVLVVICLS